MNTIKTKRETLLNPLQAIVGIVDRKHTITMLSNVLINLTSPRLTMTTSDNEIQLNYNYSFELSKNAEAINFAVSAKKFYEVLKNFPENSTVELIFNDSKLTIKSGKSRFSLHILSGENFPFTKKVEGLTSEIEIPENSLKTLLERIQFSMAQQDVRYYLNGALLQVTQNALSLVATDGHRLSFTTEKLTKNHELIEVILPRKTIHELIKLLGETDDPVKIIVREKQVQINFGEVELITKVIEGKFPDFTRVIPSGYHRHVLVKRLEFLKSLQRATVLSNEKIKGVRLLLAKNSLAILCTNTEQEEAREELDIEYEFEPMDIGFNYTYLIDVATNLTTELMKISFGDSNSSLLITGPQVEEQLKYVVMPMRI